MIDQTSSPEQKSSRFLVKLSKDAMLANVLLQEDRLPFLLIVDGENISQGRFVWAFKGQKVESTTEGNTPFSMSLFTTDELDVQLEKGGEFVNLAAALESGAARWAFWQEEYERIGLIKALAEAKEAEAKEVTEETAVTEPGPGA